MSPLSFNANNKLGLKVLEISILHLWHSDAYTKKEICLLLTLIKGLTLVPFSLKICFFLSWYVSHCIIFVWCLFTKIFMLILELINTAKFCYLTHYILLVGTTNFLLSNPSFVKDQSVEKSTVCNKDTGLKALHFWSRGIFFIVSAGGHIDYWQPLYRCSNSFIHIALFLVIWCRTTVDKVY